IPNSQFPIPNYPLPITGHTSSLRERLYLCLSAIICGFRIKTIDIKFVLHKSSINTSSADQRQIDPDRRQ
ncbi:hypothetical protein QT970_11755, partial [Microcoleus sp. herbarium8]|uniref:hypothetical protein n=1 Tax=Microcoleus sp. herbarium8 TaxID=3055436 RepID=UPI002FCF9958